MKCSQMYPPTKKKKKNTPHMNVLTIDRKEQIVSESLRWQLNGFLNEVKSPVELRSPLAQWRRAMLFTNGRVEHLPYWEWSLVPGTLGSHKASRSGPSPFSQIQNLLPIKTECTALSTDYTLQEHRDQLKKTKQKNRSLPVCNLDCRWAGSLA